MEYSNPRIPEGISVSESRPFRGFLKYACILIISVLAALFAIQALARVIAPFIPLSWEKAVLSDDFLPKPGTPHEREIQNGLQTLADRLAKEMALPEDLPITVHYDPSGTVNAFAALGGNIIVCRGLLEKIEHEEILAALLAHEIAHVQQRDVAASLLGGLGSLILTSFDSSGILVDRASHMTLLSYSRKQEDAADQAATCALAAMYGDVSGTAELFELLRNAEETGKLSAARMEFFSSHPNLSARRAGVRALAARNGWKMEGARRPLPQAIQPGSFSQ